MSSVVFLHQWQSLLDPNHPKRFREGATGSSEDIAMEVHPQTFSKNDGVCQLG